MLGCLGVDGVDPVHRVLHLSFVGAQDFAAGSFLPGVVLCSDLVLWVDLVGLVVLGVTVLCCGEQFCAQGEIYFVVVYKDVVVYFGI